MSVARILWHNFKLEFLEVWEYKINFFMLFVLELIYLGVIGLSLFAIFSFVSDIKGLTLYDLALYVVIADLSVMMIQSPGMYLVEHVTKGALNNFLIRPANELLLLVEFNASAIAYCIMNITLLTILCILFPQNISIVGFILMLFTIIFAAPLLLFPILTVRSLSFWFGEVYAIENAYRSIAQGFNKYPVIILSKIFFIIFLSITPIGYFGWYLPLAILVGKVSYSWMLWMWLVIIVLDVLMWFIFRFVYKRGLRRYEGFA